MAVYKYPVDLNDPDGLNSAAGLDPQSSSRAKMKDLMVMRVIDSSDESFNPYFNATPKGATTTVGKTKAAIWLYMPQSINASYSVEYADVNLGSIGQSVLNNYETYANGDAQSIGNKLKDLAGGMFSEVQMGTIGSAIGMASGAIGLQGDTLSGSDVSALRQKKAFNPYLENVFKGVGFRQHPFQFKFVIRSASEAAQVKGIIKTLKQAMHPDFDGDVKSKFLKIPDLFNISFLRNSGDSNTQVLYKFKPCVLTSLNVNYTPDGYYAVAGDVWSNKWDDISLAVDIQLQFKETQIITKKDFDDTLGF